MAPFRNGWQRPDRPPHQIVKIMLTTLLLTLLIVLLFLVSILFIILGERRLLAEIQGREGPSVVGFAGF